MAVYFATVFLSQLLGCEERVEVIGGKEQTCLVIPCDTAQLVRTRGGGWTLKMQCSEIPANPKGRTHRINLTFRNRDEYNKAKRLGLSLSQMRLGWLMPMGSPELTKNRTNNMTKIFCDGKLFLDSIQRDDIKVDSQTGRKYVDFAFRKTNLLDAFGNSHEIIVRNDYGEHQIGVAKEIVDEGWFQTPTNNNQPRQTNENKQSPSEYDGYKW